MGKWLMNWLKWKIAHAEMAELERWQVQWWQHRRWFAEFKEVGVVLDNLREEAKAGDPLPVPVLRQQLRLAAAKEGAQ